MRLMCALVALSSVMVSAQSPSIAPEQRRGRDHHGRASEAVEPFRIVGNIYYVGAREMTSYLIVTPEGHILHDTGTNEMHTVIVSNVEKLGFKVQDIKIMLSSHAHFDHMQGHAAMKRATGAQIVALGGDALAIESGKDNSAAGLEGWEPVKVDRVVADGDTVTLGGTTIARRLDGGAHARGNDVDDNGPGGWQHLIPSPSVAARSRTPGCSCSTIRGTRRSWPTRRERFRRLRELDPPDLFLHNHPQNRRRELSPDLPVNPKCASCLDAEGWIELVTRAEATLESRLKEAEENEKRTPGR